VIGFTVHNKIKRVVRAKRPKTLISKEFLGRLETEIERVVIQAAETVADSDEPLKLCVALPVSITKKQAKDLLVCHVRIKQRIEAVNDQIVVSRRFLDELNIYAYSMVWASTAMVDGQYLKVLASGNAVATAIDRGRVKIEGPPPVNLAAPGGPTLPSEAVELEPALPRNHTIVTWRASVHAAAGQIAVLEGKINVYTGKDEDRIALFVTRTLRDRLDQIGIPEAKEVPVTIVSIEYTK